MIVALRIIRNWLVPPAWREGPIYRKETSWVEAFDAETARHGRLALEQARIGYAGAAEAFDRLDAKLAESLRTAGLLATILVAGAAKLEMMASPCMRISLALLVASMAVCIVGRRSLLRPSGVPIRTLMEPLGDPAHLEAGQFSEIPNAEAWLAASIERATVAYRDLEEWKARKINQASALLFGGMLFLLPALAGL